MNNPGQNDRERRATVDELVDAAEAGLFEMRPGPVSIEEIVDQLSEAIWEAEEYGPSTTFGRVVWFSFWDRITQGGPIPDMPVVEEESS